MDRYLRREQEEQVVGGGGGGRGLDKQVVGAGARVTGRWGEGLRGAGGRGARGSKGGDK